VNGERYRKEQEGKQAEALYEGKAKEKEREESKPSRLGSLGRASRPQPQSPPVFGGAQGASHGLKARPFSGEGPKAPATASKPARFRGRGPENQRDRGAQGASHSLKAWPFSGEGPRKPTRHPQSPPVFGGGAPKTNETEGPRKPTRPRGPRHRPQPKSSPVFGGGAPKTNDTTPRKPTIQRPENQRYNAPKTNDTTPRKPTRQAPRKNKRKGRTWAMYMRPPIAPFCRFPRSSEAVSACGNIRGAPCPGIAVVRSSHAAR